MFLKSGSALAIFIFISNQATTYGTCDGDHCEKIVGGNETNIEEFPYLVAVFLISNDINNNTLKGGGSILTPRTALTSASLVKVPNAGPTEKKTYDLYIRYGNTNKNEGTRIDVKKSYYHKCYKDNPVINDIAIMYLRRSIPLDIGTAIAVKIPETFPANITTAKVAGWGLTDVKSGNSDVLTYMERRVYTKRKCCLMFSRIYNKTKDINFSEFHSGFICAGDRYLNDTEGPEQGDHGAALVVNGTQIGLHLFGYNGIHVYTNVSYYRDWITDMIKGYD